MVKVRFCQKKRKKKNYWCFSIFVEKKIGATNTIVDDITNSIKRPAAELNTVKLETRSKNNY